jgi:cardiolipin synthase
MEYYIVSDGVLFNRICQRLCEKIKLGVEVRLIYDDMGSRNGITRKIKKRLKSAGVKFMPFNKLVPVFAVGLNYRDHRKITIVDGKTAFTGGCNLADEYLNEKRMHGYWKDTGVKIEGKAVDGFTLMFLKQWEVIDGKREDYSLFINLYKKVQGKSVVVPYADGLDYEHDIGRGAYEKIIAGANEFVYIMTPYFIIDDGMTDLIINKALSGVDVRLVLPDVPDKTYVYSVSRNNAEKLIDYGVKVYIMKNAFVHSKLLLTENSVTVGSVNMDLRSFYQQFECGVYTDDKKVMEDVMKDFETTFSDCVLLTEKNKRRNNFIYRAFAGLMQLFAPFM